MILETETIQTSLSDAAVAELSSLVSALPCNCKERHERCGLVTS